MSGEAFAVVDDDMMFYRAAAYEVLEGRGLPVVRLAGRQPLIFTVDGQDRRYDFESVTWLDMIVLYQPGKEPMPVAAVDFSADPSFLDEYFTSD